MTEPSKKPHPLAFICAIPGAIGGWTLSHYCRASIWIPGTVMFLLMLLFAKGPVRPRYFAGAISVTGAHVSWFVLSSAVLGMWSATALDILLLTAGIIWLWRRPSLSAVLFLGLIQLGSLVVNVYAISSATFGSAPHRALTAHCVLRLIAIACLIGGYVRMRRELSASPGSNP